MSFWRICSKCSLTGLLASVLYYLELFSERLIIRALPDEVTGQQEALDLHNLILDMTCYHTCILYFLYRITLAWPMRRHSRRQIYWGTSQKLVTILVLACSILLVIVCLYNSGMAFGRLSYDPRWVVTHCGAKLRFSGMLYMLYIHNQHIVSMFLLTGFMAPGIKHGNWNVLPHYYLLQSTRKCLLHNFGVCKCQNSKTWVPEL